MIVQCTESCKNSPKKELLKDLVIAFGRKNMDFVFQHLADDVKWVLVGNQIVEGHEAFEKMLGEIIIDSPEALQIDYIITHGNVGSVNGGLKFRDEAQLHFCQIFKFTGFGKKAKIGEITSYIIR